MSNCILCLNKTLKKNSVEISEVDESGLSIKEIIIQHFWFYEKILTFSSSQKLEVTCRNCWSKLEAFHEFFTAVKLSHKADHFEDEIETKIEAQAESILLKSEEDQQQVIEIKDLEDVESYDGNFEGFEEHLDIKIEVDEILRRSLRKRKIADVAEVQKPPKIPKKRLKKLPKDPQKKEERKYKYNVSDEEMETLKLHTKIECELCRRKSSNWVDIRQHFKDNHKEIKRAWIRCCGRKLDTTMLLKDHVKWHKNPNAFQCDICLNSYPNTEALRFHKTFHIPDEDRPHKCKKCDKRFSTISLLKAHMIGVHAKEGKTPTLPCETCGKLYKTDYQLKDHIYKNHKAKPKNLVCDICSKVLTSNHSFKLHMKNHLNPDTVEDQRQCTICGNFQRNERNWRKHMLKHKDEENGPYECIEGCGKVFKNRVLMRRHINYFHSANKFACKFCDVTFKSKVVLKEHEAGHLGIDLYSCQFCDKTFRSNANMYNHRKKAHPEEVKNLPKPSYMGKVQQESE